MKRIATAMLAAILVAGAQTKDEAERLLKAAKNVELVDGDLKGAIKRYGEIAAKYAKTDRATAAMALVRMAECHQKMGDAESRKIYERVVREYGDQKEAVAMARKQLGGSRQPPTQTDTMVWSDPKFNANGTVSADGRFVSYVDWDTGDLAVHELATGIDRHLTNKGTWKESEDFAEESAISKDGEKIIYTWWKAKEQRPELRIGNLAGSFSPRTIYDNPDISWIYVYDWSPDGKSAAIKIERNDRTSQIGLITVPEGSLRVLKSIDWRGTGKISFSPDGRYLGYDLPQSDSGPLRDVYVLSIDGAREIHAVAHQSDDKMMGWSPDGKWLLFASDRTGSSDLWGLPFADGKPAGSPELLRSSIAAHASPVGVTRSGALFYVAAGARRGLSKIQVVSFDFAAGRIVSAPQDVTTAHLESNRYAEWSPDGTQLAYTTERGPFGAGPQSSNAFLTIRSIGNNQVRELHPKLSYFGLPRWSRDGRALLTHGADFKGRRGVFTIDAATGDVQTVSLDALSEQTRFPPVWAPDEKSIYASRFYNRSKEYAFIRRDLDTGTETEVIRRSFLGGVNISPDGQSIATPSVDPSTNSRLLLLIPRNGGPVRTLMSVPSGVPPEDLADQGKGLWLRIGCWAPDSQSILAWKQMPGTKNNDEGLQVPLDGGEPRKIDANLSLNPGGLSVHPDGKRMVFTVFDQTPPRNGELRALDNFLPRSASK